MTARHEAILAEQAAHEAKVVSEVRGSYLERVEAIQHNAQLAAMRVPDLMRAAIDGYACRALEGVRCDPATPEQCAEAGAQVRQLFYLREGRTPTRDEQCAINRATLAEWERRGIIGAAERQAQRDARRMA